MFTARATCTFTGVICGRNGPLRYHKLHRETNVDGLSRDLSPNVVH